MSILLSGCYDRITSYPPLTSRSSSTGLNKLVDHRTVDDSFYAPATAGASGATTIASACPQSDGKIVTVDVQVAPTYGGQTLMRFTANGELDTEFNKQVLVSNTYTPNVRVAADDSIYVTNALTSGTRTIITKFRPNGDVDTDFSCTLPSDQATKREYISLTHIQIDTDGTLLVLYNGYTTTSTPWPCVYRVNGATGAILGKLIEIRYSALDGGNRPCILLPAGDGTFYLVQRWPNYPDDTHTVLHLDYNGAAVTGWNFTPVTTNIQCMALQPDGKLLIARRATTKATSIIERYNTDGSPDNAFNANMSAYVFSEGIGACVETMCVDSSGVLHVGGWFTSCTNTNTYVARYAAFI